MRRYATRTWRQPYFAAADGLQAVGYCKKLLAPGTVVFFKKDWEELDTK